MTTYIGVFAKHWTPGKTKTRLAESIGKLEAAECSRVFLATTLKRLDQLGDHQILAYSPAPNRSDFVELLNLHSLDWSIVPQSDGDLGMRMQTFFQEGFDQGAQSVVLLGSDSPDFPLEELSKGINWLEKKSEGDRGLFLGPSQDGGYWSVGMSREVAPIFSEMPWSKSSLMEATLARLEQLGWKRGADFRLLDTWYDVDNHADLSLLSQRLRNASKHGKFLEILNQQINKYL